VNGPALLEDAEGSRVKKLCWREHGMFRVRKHLEKKRLCGINTVGAQVVPCRAAVVATASTTVTTVAATAMSRDHSHPLNGSGKRGEPFRLLRLHLHGRVKDFAAQRERHAAVGTASIVLGLLSNTGTVAIAHQTIGFRKSLEKRE
jgi:hypothetical protein